MNAIRQVADRLRRHRESWSEEYRNTQQGSDESTLADFALPLLDETAIDEVWLKSIGFVFPAKVRGCQQHCYAPLLPGAATSRMHCGVRSDGTVFVYVSTVDCPHIKTRGELRLLCLGLGITLQEKGGE